MEANDFRGSVGEIPPSQACISAATWLKLADYYNQQNAPRDLFFSSASCVIKMFWRFFFLSWYIQTNQAYFTHLKDNNRDDYVSIYRLHGGLSVWLLNFVFSLPIYLIISLQHYICVINLLFGHVITHVGIIFFVTASEVCKNTLRNPVFKDVISTLIEL